MYEKLLKNLQKFAKILNFLSIIAIMLKISQKVDNFSL